MNLLLHGITFVTLMLLVLCLRKIAANSQSALNSKFVYRMNVAAILFALLAGPFFLVAIFNMSYNHLARCIAIIMALTGTIYAIALIFTRYEIFHDCVEKSVFGHRASILYSDVVSVTEDEWSQCLVIRGSRGERMTVSFYVSGFSSLHSEITSRVAAQNAGGGRQYSPTR